MNRELRRVAALLGAAALILPSAALAKGKPEGKPVKPAHGKSKPANYVFKGVWHADGSVTVTGGNARVRKGGFVGQVVSFDVAAAKLRAADTNSSNACWIWRAATSRKRTIAACLVTWRRTAG